LETALREAEGSGPSETRLATSLNNLAALAMAQGQYPQAEPFFQRALTMLEHTLGSAHPVVATSLENYAELLRRMDRHTEAVTVETHAHAMRAKHATERPSKAGGGG
jgi:tetratricopeptide (TPR) repeat protein